MPPRLWDVVQAEQITPEAFAGMDQADLLSLAQECTDFFREDRKQNALLYYRPVSDQAKRIHLSTARNIAVFGGNRSSKTESCLVDLVVQMTGMVPFGLRGVYPWEKVKCPGNYRIVVESLTTTLEQIILPKLQFWHWDGVDEPGGARGHWGWIPKRFLIGEDWTKSWSKGTSVLRLSCGCICQFMSHSQDPSDFASGMFHAILHDELPKKAIWNENRARLMGTSGRLYLAMTPPDDAGIAVDWVYDELYEPGQPGPLKDPDVDAITLFTEHNPNLDQSEVQKRAAEMTESDREVRLHGRFLTLSNLIHPLFSTELQWWCFTCNTRLIAVADGKCPRCENTNIGQYRHIDEYFQYRENYPVVMVLDPHPRKKHCLAWIAVDPADDAIQVSELEIDAEPVGVKAAVDRLEEDLRLQVCRRIMDPNMGESPARADKRNVTWRREFATAGLLCDLAKDSFATGKSRINEALQPDSKTRQPRMRMTPACPRTAFQFARYSWDEWARYTQDQRDPKERPKPKHDDFPAIWRYFMNGGFTFDGLRMGGQVIRTRESGRERSRR